MLEAPPVVTSAPRRNDFTHLAQDAWALAPLIAGQPVYRAGHRVDGTMRYRATASHPITSTLPAAPAAVMVHAVDGSVPTLCLDLDTSRTARRIVVDTDAARLGQLLTGAGLAYVEDQSPSGGRHLYVPLQDAITAVEARELVEALGEHAPSLDPGPHRNVTDGCIRVPGSRHKLGGHQMLITPLTEAYGILRRRNPTEALTALRQTLAPELHRREQTRKSQQHAAVAAIAALTSPVDVETGPSTDSGAARGSVLRSVARTGLYDANRYDSASEARMAVLNHLVACGWTIGQVHARMSDTFAGLASLYTDDKRATRLLAKEWAKAQAFVAAKTRSQRQGKSYAPTCDTSPTTALTPPTPSDDSSEDSSSSRESVHRLVNDLEVVTYTVLDRRFEDLGATCTPVKFLMRALLGFMRTMETNIVSVGCRSLAVATGMSHDTIARHLRTLERVSRGIVTRIERGRGRAADVYSLQLPTDLEQVARALTWRKGKIYGIRPVFRVLGSGAALAYEGIERARHSPTTMDLSRATRISRNTLHDHLATMERLRMIRRHHGVWQIVATTNLRQLADRLGASDDVSTQLDQYRKERRIWHARLSRHDTQLGEHEVYDHESDDYWLPPADDDRTHHLALWNASRTTA